MVAGVGFVIVDIGNETRGVHAYLPDAVDEKKGEIEISAPLIPRLVPLLNELRKTPRMGTARCYVKVFFLPRCQRLL